MTEQIRDVLRHLEKDMADILDVMQDIKTTEIILNPYPTYNGQYIGYILLDQHGSGLQNYTRVSIKSIETPTVNIGDIIVYKKLKLDGDNILFWVKLNLSFIDTLRKISLCIKSICLADKIIQSHDFGILHFAEMLEDGYILGIALDGADFGSEVSINKLINEINQKLPIDTKFVLNTLIINNYNDINDLQKYPSSIITTELVKMTSGRAETIMSVLASITNKYLHNKQPYLECQIPKYGHRFTGVIPPVVPFPAFCIRKHSLQIYTLNDFVAQGTLQPTSRDTILNWIFRKFNILIAGGTGSGKTTLANAILFEISHMYPDTRVLIIEDVPELKFNATRSIGFSINEFFSMYDALRTTLRFKPDRIVMGEVRGAEAYTLLKAWNTGHPGGLATIHANGVNEALYRFESCICDHPNVRINRQEIGFTVNGIIAIDNITQREEHSGEYVNVVRRKVTALRQIIAYDPEKNIYQDIVYDKLSMQL